MKLIPTLFFFILFATGCEDTKKSYGQLHENAVEYYSRALQKQYKGDSLLTQNSSQMTRADFDSALKKIAKNPQEALFFVEEILAELDTIQKHINQQTEEQKNNVSHH